MISPYTPEKMTKKFFDTIEQLFNYSDDSETIKNLSRSLASFSKNKNYIFMIIESNLFPHIVELFENPDTDISTRRYAATAIANISSGFYSI